MKVLGQLIGNENLDSLCKTMGNLYGRWQDEKKYEDFEDYIACIKKVVPAGCSFVSMTKKPFQIVFAIKDNQATYGFIRVKANKMEWGQIKKAA